MGQLLASRNVAACSDEGVSILVKVMTKHFLENIENEAISK